MDGSLLFICDITNLRVHQRLSLTPLLMVLVLSPHPPLPHPPLLPPPPLVSDHGPLG